MVAKLKLQGRSAEDRGGDMRTGAGGGHTLEREEISIRNPLSERRNIDKC